MSALRSTANFILRVLHGPKKAIPNDVQSIFVLRNNDIGDVLTVTPLFEALRARFPSARIVAGVGNWARPVLENNPMVDEVLSINAPWHNKAVTRFPANSLRGMWDALSYVMKSPESAALLGQKFSVGIDVLGSPQGSLLLQHARIPFILGVDGYAGGEGGCDATVQYTAQKPVSSMALEFATVLKPGVLPAPRPQLFLTPPEYQDAHTRWDEFAGGEGPRIVIHATAGLREKCWPIESFRELIAKVVQTVPSAGLALIGASGEKELLSSLAVGSNVANFAGTTTLRETFGMIATSDLVICNSSMTLHAAAAFSKKCVLLLGEYYQDAPAHHAQWAYPETVTLGKNPRHRSIYRPEEVFHLLPLKQALSGRQALLQGL